VIEDLRQAVREDFPAAVEQLSELVRIPAMAWDAFDPAELGVAAAHVAGLVGEAGMADVVLLQASRPDGMPGAPAVVGRRPARPGQPTILLYAHYDVQPVGDLTLWHSPPFEAVERDGRLWGRGAADNRAGVLLHVGALRSALRVLGDELGWASRCSSTVRRKRDRPACRCCCRNTRPCSTPTSWWSPIPATGRWAFRP
jgi:acetylornithine deacetylase/succinyl-diaminopimelate desuccinylase-like protein